MQSLDDFSPSTGGNFFCCDFAKYGFTLLAAIAVCGLMFGCNPSATDVSKSVETATEKADAATSAGFGVLVDGLDKIHRAIDEGKGDGSVSEVHEAMHNVTPAIQKLVLACVPGSSGLTEEAAAEAKTAATRLGELYGKLDSALHGGEECSYEDISTELGELMEKLKSLKP